MQQLSRECLQLACEIKGVPSSVVDGKFATSAGMTGSICQRMHLVDQRVELTRKERGK